MIAAITALFASASKIVFLVIALTACAAFLMGKLEAKDFMVLCIGVFGYYFGYKPSDQPIAPPNGAGTGAGVADATVPPPVPATPTATIAGTGPAMAPGVK
jgi:hypothetical protein